ncbi:CpxP family protein [Vibrio parahaemolyticus]|uniref:CpxP family protein n=1 Tax=Vibrio parahaemolyticus TaxID=670 RepID=UPI001124CBD8|nr:CpxP family protein [Vibrio parahaemolyticus]TOD63843.1 stress adaptor protein CpxP [Vibrio parahaemolyticus]TOD64658.1 stress adaptor protein CpxP [Vibrio parahaemolyticus]
MKSVKIFVLAAIVLPLTFGTAGALAFGGQHYHNGPHDECGMGMGMDRGVMRHLNLTQAQQEQLRSLRDTNRAEMRSKYAEHHQARRAEHHAKMQSLLLADTFDEAQATALAKEMVDLHTEYRVRMLERKHQMLSVLTPEQKAEFVKLQNERMQECGDPMQQRMGKHRNN